MPEIKLHFDLWPRQLVALNSPATEWLYGGAAGGGKSHLERVLSILWCLEIPSLQYYLFRRSYSDLVKSYIEGPTGYKAMLSDLITAGVVEAVAKEIRFPNGSKIYLCHCQHESDVFNFGSFEFHVLDLAEAGQFTPFMINYLRSRVRMPKDFQKRLPKKYLMPKQYWQKKTVPEYQFPRIVYTSNPIGPGKAKLKADFVDGHNPDLPWRASVAEGGMLRQFIPAKLSDNPSLDPESYAAQLRGIGSQAYVDALLDGNWNTTVGAFFPQIDRTIHVLKPFMIPQHWPKFMAYDHGACGSGDPFSCGWYTIADGSIDARCAYAQRMMPLKRGALICYRRWNGRGLQKQTVIEIAKGIKEREKGEKILFRSAGGDIVEQRGLVAADTNQLKGESVFTLFKSLDIHFLQADRRRVNGWSQVDYRLTGENGIPLSFWFQDAEEDLETLSSLQHDLHDPSDIAQGDDHDADRHRYACMTRPIVKDAVIPSQSVYHGVGGRSQSVSSLIENFRQEGRSFGRR